MIYWFKKLPTSAKLLLIGASTILVGIFPKVGLADTIFMVGVFVVVGGVCAWVWVDSK